MGWDHTDKKNRSVFHPCQSALIRGRLLSGIIVQPRPSPSRQHCSSSSSRRSPPGSHLLPTPNSESSPEEATAPSRCPCSRSPEPGRPSCPSPTLSRARTKQSPNRSRKIGRASCREREEREEVAVC